MDLKFVAGLFEGEGYVTFTTRKARRKKTGRVVPQHTLRVGINMTDPVWLVDICREFGGSLTRIAARRGALGKRPIYQWTVCAGRAAAFLAAILPFIKVKREVALVALGFQEHLASHNRRRGQKLSASEVAFREYCRRRVQELNAATPDPTPYDMWANSGKPRPGNPEPSSEADEAERACVTTMGPRGDGAARYSLVPAGMPAGASPARASA